MHGQIPDDADVVLEKPEIHSHRVVVVDVAEVTAVHDLTDFPDRARVDERVIDHQHPAAPLRKVHQARRLFGGRGERLFDHDVLAGLERAAREVEVRRDRRRDRDGVDGLIDDHLVGAGGHPHPGMARRGAVEARRAQVADGVHDDPGSFREVADEIGTPVAVTDDANSNHAVLRARLRIIGYWLRDVQIFPCGLAAIAARNRATPCRFLFVSLASELVRLTNKLGTWLKSPGRSRIGNSEFSIQTDEANEPGASGRRRGAGTTGSA